MGFLQGAPAHAGSTVDRSAASARPTAAPPVPDLLLLGPQQGGQGQAFTHFFPTRAGWAPRALGRDPQRPRTVGAYNVINGRSWIVRIPGNGSLRQYTTSGRMFVTSTERTSDPSGLAPDRTVIRMWAFEVSTGRRLWVRDVSEFGNGVAAASDSWLLLEKSRDFGDPIVYCVLGVSTSELGACFTPDQGLGPDGMSDDGILMTGVMTDRVASYSPQTGQLQWTLPGTGNWPVVWLYDGRFAVGANTTNVGFIVANARTGEAQSQISVPQGGGRGSFVPAPTGPWGYASGDRWMANTDSGAIAWVVQGSAASAQPVGIVCGTRVWGVPDQGGRVVVRELATGKVLRFEAAAPVACLPSGRPVYARWSGGGPVRYVIGPA